MKEDKEKIEEQEIEREKREDEEHVIDALKL